MISIYWIVVWGLLGCISAMIGFFSLKNIVRDICFIVSLLSIVLTITSAVLCGVQTQDNIAKVQYKVYIDGNTTFEEFNKYYRMVGVSEDAYIVELKQ